MGFLRSLYRWFNPMQRTQFDLFVDPLSVLSLRLLRAAPRVSPTALDLQEVIAPGYAPFLVPTRPTIVYGPDWTSASLKTRATWNYEGGPDQAQSYGVFLHCTNDGVQYVLGFDNFSPLEDYLLQYGPNTLDIALTFWATQQRGG